MKDAVITVRVPSATRAHLERLAREEGRSLSQEIERLIERAIGLELPGAPPPRGRPRRLAGALPLARVPTLDDFRGVRATLSAALAGREAKRDQRRR